MNLLFRLLRFLAITIFNFLLSLIALMFTLIVLPILIWVVRTLRALVFMSFTATVHGPPVFASRLASQWTRGFLESGADRNRIDQIYSLCYFAAASMIVLGWVISILFTVTVLRVVFGFFI